MNRYRILLKDGTIAEAESKWIDISTICNILVDHQPFIQIGDTVFAKDSIAMIGQIEKNEKEF